MARANFQVLALPFMVCDSNIKYAVFLRSDMNIWQFIAGGGENDETPLEAAKREAYEEANIDHDTLFYALDTCCSIPAGIFRESDRKRWGENCYVVPEYTFAIKMKAENMKLSHEHIKYEWTDYETAKKRLRYDSNKVALYELDTRIKKGLLGEGR